MMSISRLASALVLSATVLLPGAASAQYAPYQPGYGNPNDPNAVYGAPGYVAPGYVVPIYAPGSLGRRGWGGRGHGGFRGGGGGGGHGGGGHGGHR